MTIAAITTSGREYLYKAASAHKLNAKKAAAIVGLLNGCKYRLKDGETWRIYTINQYDIKPYVYATSQAFILTNNGVLKEKISF